MTFRDLHRKGDLLILPNAWDAGSARLIESCGAKAIATSSAALAWANGFPDGDKLPMGVLLRSIESIARIIRVPLSVDSEGGYSDDLKTFATNLYGIASAGAAGVNLEDGTRPPELLAAKIAAAKTAGERAGVDLFVNARVDVLLHSLVPRERAMDEIRRRVDIYRDAGADGIFVPYLADRDEIATVVQAVDPLPLNVLAVPELPAAPELRVLGVRRLSAGAAVARASIVLVKRLATNFLANGASNTIFEAITEKIDVNGLMS